MSSTGRCCLVGGGHRETEEAWTARAGTPFSFSFLGAPGGKVFLAVADAALHDVAVPVLGILSSTETFSAAMAPTLSLLGEEGSHIFIVRFLRPHKGLA